MDQVTASYYRSILFHDGTDQRPVPPTLIAFHTWAFKRFQAMGAGGIISKPAALSVAIAWLSTTAEGRAFAKEFIPAIGELFCEDDAKPVRDGSGTEWKSIPAETPVIVTVENKAIAGKFVKYRGGEWVDVQVGEKTDKFRTKQVQLAGA